MCATREKGSRINKQDVVDVKQFIEKGFTSKDIIRFTGISAGTVSAIRNGEYDDLLNDKPDAHLQVQDGVVDRLEEVLDVLNVIAERLGVLITNG